MPVTVRGTDILFNDGTTQSTAAGAVPYAGGRGQVFTANGTFTIPTGVTAVKVTVVGGGGGGGNGFQDFCSAVDGGAGAGGGTGISFLTGLTPGNTISVAIGAGGAGKSAGSFGAGSTGGTSSISSGTQTITTISATGGGSVQTARYSAQPGNCTTAQINITGTTKELTPSPNGQTTGGAAGGSSYMGKGAPPPSYIGGGSYVAGTSATQFGGGGSGSYTGNYGSVPAGGAGAAGAVIFEW